jgi:uncharacterized coiled-coil protein SlyX
LQIVLNKKDKELLVIKLHEEGKTKRLIAAEAHMSFGDIGKIIRRINGHDKDDDIEAKDLKLKSKTTQALYLFKNGKKPIDVAIELDLTTNEVEDIEQEFWILNQLDGLALVYLEVKNCLTLFLRLFHTMKKNKLINQKDIQTILRYTAHDLPSLENKFHKLSNDVIDLEIKKKELENTITLQNTQLIDLGQVITQNQNAIYIKKEQLMKMDKQLVIQHGKSKSDKH